MTVKFILRNKQENPIGIQFEPDGQHQWINTSESILFISKSENRNGGGTISMDLGKVKEGHFHQVASTSFQGNYDAYFNGEYITSG